ncbi:LAME_0H19152g1_1 [Lachancea meyersii CBS 8951]|uniref:LAME_0H19152g1_1 n=1 Tax=Lachancea meyersii CBS 8951 TaxID=1266667 RepID=A0A1G4KIZ1_9SACH|nr:LAME_0H19152g1_1 [Lachancea meyersii CBS 8951]
MSASSINRSLTTVKTELEFLLESDVISQETFQNIVSALPERYNPEPRRNAPAMPQNEFVEAIYAFQAQQDGDLELSVGDKIEVLEKPSPEWYKGKCNGRIGMFPSNYVKPAFSGSSTTEAERTTLPPPPQYQSQQIIQPQQTNTSMQSGYSQPQFPPPSTNYYQNPPQQHYQNPQQQAYYQSPAPQLAPAQEAQQHHAGGQAFKKFGSKLGNAAIFGAGATIGSDIVNSIF